MKTHLVVGLIGIVILALGLTAYREPKQDLVVNNSLKGVRVLSFVETNEAFELVLRNDANKSINGYSILFNNNAFRTVDLIVGEKRISPGDRFTVSLPPRREILPITIRYLVFEDGSGEGDVVGTGELQDRRAGRAEQIRRISPLLERALSNADIEKLKTEIGDLSEEPIGGRSIYFQQGRLDAKEDALLTIQRLDHTNVRGGLNRLKEQNNKTLERINKSNK